MFDLPVTTERGIGEYRKFRKFLLKNGFLMMQESIYSKIVQNNTAADTLIKQLKLHKPSDGVVQVMKITEKQYSKIEYIVGEKTSSVVDTDERTLYL